MAWAKNGTPDTLGSSGDQIEITDMSDVKFNIFLLHFIDSGNTGDDTNFNANTNAVYATRKSTNGNADGTLTSDTAMEFNTNAAAWYNSAFRVMYTCSISGEEKLTIAHEVTQNTTGAGTTPERIEYTGKFVPSPDAGITGIDVTNDESGSFDTSSNLSAIGTD
jgi:hypothetical protein